MNVKLVHSRNNWGEPELIIIVTIATYPVAVMYGYTSTNNTQAL